MIVRPAARRPETVRPALLVDSGRARSLDDGRLHDLARLPKGLRCYAAWDTVDTLARAGEGELLAWGEEPIRWRAARRGDSHRRSSDVVIVKLPAGSERELAAGLVAWADWLASHGCNPGWSLGGSSMALLRASLDEPLVTTNGALPAPRWTLGGRQQCFVEPGTAVRGAIQLDLPAAYTTEIGLLRYGGAWRELDGNDLALRRLTLFGAHYPLLVQARVSLPSGLAAGPLHRRPQRRPETRIEELAPTVPYPASGRLQGIWTWHEIREALEAGALVRPLRAWLHAGADRPFERWYETVLEGRALGGFAGQLAKATGNALWGQFVIDDRKRLCVQRWNGRYTSRPVQGSRGHQIRAWDLGELVCGQVRAKLYRALRGAAPEDLLCAHTDGLWLRDSAASERLRTELEAEGWRCKSEAATIEILDQQKYRYRERGARRSQVVCSGVTSGRAAETFQALWERFTAPLVV